MNERTATLATDRAALFKDQEPLTGPLSLPQAMARAVKYNLEDRLRLMEEGISRRQLDLSRYDLLPKAMATAGWNSRNKYPASSSMSVDTGTQSLVPSTSQERSHDTFDLGLSWNALDFGVSYYQAHQQADRTLIMQERKRKAVHNLLQQVRQAYWMAVGAQQLEPKVAPLLNEVEKAVQDSRTAEKEKLRTPLDSLGYRRQLLDTLRQLEGIRDELAQATPRLASLINAEPGRALKLAAPTKLNVMKLQGSLEQMEEAALLNRPEVLEAAYNERISVLETKKAVAKLLPGIELNLGGHYDSNRFLVDNNWTDAGLRISWNLFNVLSAQAIMDTADAQLELAKTRRLALNMAVLSQVHIGYRDYLGRQRQFELARDLDEIDQGILEHTRNGYVSSVQGKLAEIRASVAALMSELRVYQSYGQYQNAYGQMLATLGVDPLPNELPGKDVETVAKALTEVELNWQNRSVSEWAGKKAAK